MKLWKRKPPKMLLLVAVMLALLALLATLQYRWLGQVSMGERERMQASVSAGATRFGQDFNREITRAYLSFQLDAAMLREEHAGEFAERYAQWDSKAPYPQLVSDVFIFERDERASLRLSRFNREQKKFEPVEWPAELAQLRTRLEQELLQNINHDGDREISLDPVEPDVPAIVSPIIAAPGVVLPRQQEIREDARGLGKAELPDIGDLAPFSGYVIVKLDLDVIKNELLPTLARRYFSGSDGLEYNLAVINPKAPGKPIYQSSQTPPQKQATNGDATARLMDVQLDQLDTLFFGLPRRPATSKDKETIFTQKLPPGQIYMRSDEQSHNGNSSARSVTVRVFNREMQDKVAADKNAGAGPWQLLIQHRAGSLEAAVTSARHRNLAISFGILLLLAGSVTMIVVSTRRAERLAHRQMEFVSAVSHEFRTPLAVICSAGENLADGIVDAPQQVAKYGALVRNEGRRLTEMVEQVLEFAGARSGRRSYQLRPVEIESVIEDALASYQPLIKEKGYVIEKKIASGLPLVEADAAALRRSVQNLLSNAMKYDGGNHWIGIRAQSGTGQRGEEVQITVEDQGVGIAPDEVSRVFEPFYRGREVVEAQIHGNGLGLSLVKQVIEAHKGSASVVSVQGQGSAFTLHLPAINQTGEENGAGRL
jgi:signal transduction histidine kinase